MSTHLGHRAPSAYRAPSSTVQPTGFRIEPTRSGLTYTYSIRRSDSPCCHDS